MTYKEISKANWEIMAKTQIFSEYIKWAKICSLSHRYSMHRNTVRNIIQTWEKHISFRNKETLRNKSVDSSWIWKTMQFFEYGSRKPLSHPKIATQEEEQRIIDWHKNTKWAGYKRCFTHFQRSWDKSLVSIWIQKIRGVYKRNKLVSTKKRSMNGEQRQLYDYTALACFEECHVDVKVITDQHALPENVYKKFKHDPHLPTYEWNFIDAKSRFRLIGYSHTHDSDFGWKFIVMCLTFIRSKWYLYPINLWFDWWSEFCSASKRKLTVLQELVTPLWVTVYQYDWPKDIRKNLIERSHLSDDEELYIPRGMLINNKHDFIREVHDYSYYWNAQRAHTGKGMNNRTPVEVLKDSKIHNAESFLDFPVMILEDYYKPLSLIVDTLTKKSEAFFLDNAHYVLTQYQIKSILYPSIILK